MIEVTPTYRSTLRVPKDVPHLLCLPRVPWSFSALEKFEKCPKQYGEVNVAKAYPFETSPQMEAGKEVHKLLENHVNLGYPLPPGLKAIGTYIDRLSASAIEVSGEQNISFTHMLQICTNFDDDISYRGKIDYFARLRDAIVVVDYKTSSEPREGDDQLEFMAVACLLKYDAIDIVHAMFMYTKHPPRRITVTRKEIPRLVEEIRPRLIRLKEARDTKTFPPTPGSACKWCPVVTCQFHPRRK